MQECARLGFGNLFLIPGFKRWEKVRRFKRSRIPGAVRIRQNCGQDSKAKVMAALLFLMAPGQGKQLAPEQIVNLGWSQPEIVAAEGSEVEPSEAFAAAADDKGRR